MLYPKISNIKRSNMVIKIAIVISILLAISTMIVNHYTSPNLHWSWLVIVGIIYVWITTIYSIKKNINIASSVMIQMLCSSVLLIIIDYVIGYKGWSIRIGLPIVIMVANITMVVLTLVSHKRYYNYSLYQIIIMLATILMLSLIPFGVTKLNVLYMVASGISVISLILSFSLCGKEIVNQIQKTFHM